jgi:hypothetical protein
MENEENVLFLLHFAAATLDGTGATFGDNHLRAAFAAEVHLPDLVCHESFLLFDIPTLQ